MTILQLFFNSLAAYVFAKRKFPGRDVIFMLFLATMMMPGQVTLIPNYLVLKHIPLFGGNDIVRATAATAGSTPTTGSSCPGR